MKHVLILYQTFAIPSGSAMIRTYEVAKNLVKKGYKVTVITGTSPRTGIQTSNKVERRNIDGINVIILDIEYSNKMRIRKRYIQYFRFAFEAIKHGLKEKDIDLVYAVSAPITIGIPGYVISKFKKAIYVFEAADLWPDVPIAMKTLKNKTIIKLAYWLEHFTYRKADRIIALVTGIKDRIIEKGFDKNKIDVVPTFADLELFTNGEDDYCYRNNLNIPDNQFICTYVGALSFMNDFIQVLRCAKILKEKFVKDISFLVIGQGIEKDNLIKFKEEHNLDNVIFHDPIPKKDLPKILAASDLGLVIFQNLKVLTDTACSNKYFDYMAAGRPLLLNFGGWQTELIETSIAGIGTEPNNPEDMANKIINLKNNPELIKQMKINSRKLAEVEFNKEKILNEIERIFNKLIISKEV
ncbi:MAG: glycosyltransferase family 4 protein [Cyanobacteriota bacterium]